MFHLEYCENELKLKHFIISLINYILYILQRIITRIIFIFSTIPLHHQGCYYALSSSLVSLVYSWNARGQVTAGMGAGLTGQVGWAAGSMIEGNFLGVLLARWSTLGIQSLVDISLELLSSEVVDVLVLVLVVDLVDLSVHRLLVLHHHILVTVATLHRHGLPHHGLGLHLLLHGHSLLVSQQLLLVFICSLSCLIFP